jgi:WS/DGAT/MGAT family acyltransferase
MANKLPTRLSHADAAFINFDREWYPYNVGSVGIYEGVMPFDAYLAHCDRRLDEVPRYRQRLVRVPFELAYPAWHDDPDFDIGRHISQVTLPPPGDEAQLRRLAGEFFATPLDRSKALWEIRLVSGLSGGRTAHIAKMHHCLVDGVAGAQLLAALLDTEPLPPEEPRGEPLPPAGPVPGPAARLVAAAFDRVRAQLSVTEAVALAVVDPTAAARSVRSVARAFQEGWPYLFHIGRMPWATKLTAPSRLAWQMIPFDAAHRVKEALQGTINDVVLTVLAGALGRYLASHDEETEGVVARVLIPVNVRGAAEEQDLGNRVSFMLAGLPVGEDDPIARFRAVHGEIVHLKETDQAGGLDRLSSFIGLTPPALQRFLAARLSAPNFIYDLVCTNVPGPRMPLYCMGHRMTEHHPWVPIGWRAGLGVAVMSYNQGLYFSLTADQSVLSDLDRLAGYISEAFDELYEAAVGRERLVAAPALPAVFAVARDEAQRVVD